MFGLSTQHLLTSMTPYVASWGYVIVGVMVVLGNIGVPVPEETILLVGGYFAAKGLLDLRGLIPIAVLSATGGDSLGYWIGQWGGRRLLLRYGAGLGITSVRLLRAERYFDRYGVLTIFLARFITGLRFMAGPLAGAFRMPFTRFLPYNLAGAIVYCTAMLSAAYLSAPFFDRAVHLITLVNWVVALLALAVGVRVGCWWLRRGSGSSREPGASHAPMKRPMAVTIPAVFLLLTPFVQLASIRFGVPILNLGEASLRASLIYGLAAPVVGWMLWRMHPRARFAFYIFVSCELIRFWRHGLLHLEVPLLYAGLIIWLYTPAARAALPMIRATDRLAAYSRVWGGYRGSGSSSG